MEKQVVIDTIRKAFANVTLGDGVGLWQGQAIDDYEVEAEQLKQRQRDEKLDWSRILANDLQICHSSLSFFDAEGMRFHLPAYITASITDGIDDPIFHLTDLRGYAKSQLDILDTEQRQAVAVYLEWCLQEEDYVYDHESIEQALLEYWWE
ncbi:MAG: DUF6714 family protein [Spirochaetota bacterium]